MDSSPHHRPCTRLQVKTRQRGHKQETALTESGLPAAHSVRRPGTPSRTCGRWRGRPPGRSWTCCRVRAAA